MFRFLQPKSLPPITLFHNPTLTSSAHALTILKQASTIASETATEDQASDYSNHAKNQQTEFQLEVTEGSPTNDQLRSILDYVADNGVGKKKTYVPGEIVKGARDAEDALARFKEDKERFVRPITVDWNGGRAVIGEDESEILSMLRQVGQSDVD
ncbi:uncharacterized protein ASPGLDRAFT_147994 [Aspergillus glaucus CBS 516.65]|uniref:Thioredoxin-like protein n=1 Tax=Aspergillus glaucus CBS 516.65 TaxID=1160497 RepID=A0A1L9VMR6_ASPGL|nr:hypothetical protein ASPGLDRAFT_147994 [Aspergillus glaucus CBS 516.65]OJJ85174.1 hypothetical protein ASPGLDRAFT_147994 [Aspergillus glaucus CBS 516.65]